MLSSPLPFRGRAFLGLAALALPLFLAAALPAEAPRPEQTLTLGQETQEQPIKAGEAHPWRVVVPPGTSVLVTVDQRSIGLVAEVREPGGGKLFGAGNDRWGPVVLLLDVPGDYKIADRPRDKGPWPGRYTMHAEAVPSSGERHDALALMSRAGREAVPDTPKSRRQALNIYRKALVVWKGLDEPAWEAEALMCAAILEHRSEDLKTATQDLQALLLRQDLSDARRAEILDRLANLYLGSQGPDKTHTAWEGSLALWQRLGESLEETNIQNDLCYLDLKGGDPERALDCFQKVLPSFQ